MRLFDERELLFAATIPWPNGKPKVKDRPRFNNNTRKVYTPKETEIVEAAIAKHWDENGYPTFDEPIEVRIAFTNTDIDVTIYSASEHENRKLRGDLDNYLKLVLDALNEHAYTDDRIIVKLSGEKL